MGPTRHAVESQFEEAMSEARVTQSKYYWLILALSSDHMTYWLERLDPICHDFEHR
jgi:hypothetical protein